MKINVREVSQVVPETWNERVQSVREGTINQSTHVEGFHLVTGGWYRPIYLVAEDNFGQVLGQLVALRGFFSGKETLNNPLIKSMLNRMMGTYMWLEGPLVFDKGNLSAIQRALIEYIDAKAEREIYMIKRATLPYYEEEILREEVRKNLGVSSFCNSCNSSMATFLVDLRRSQQELWDALKSSARKNLRKIQTADYMQISAIENEVDAEIYWQIYSETQQRMGRSLSYKTFAVFMDEFWEDAHNQGLLQGALVKTKDGLPLAGLLFRCYNGWIQEFGVAYTNESIERKLYGQDLLKWYIMQWGAERGYTYYDLMGVEVNSDDPKKRGIYQFKAKWGGELVNYPVYTKVYSPWKHKFFQGGRSLVEGVNRLRRASTDVT